MTGYYEAMQLAEDQQEREREELMRLRKRVKLLEDILDQLVWEDNEGRLLTTHHADQNVTDLVGPAYGLAGK